MCIRDSKIGSEVLLSEDRFLLPLECGTPLVVELLRVAYAHDLVQHVIATAHFSASVRRQLTNIRLEDRFQRDRRQLPRLDPRNLPCRAPGDLALRALLQLAELRLTGLARQCRRLLSLQASLDLRLDGIEWSDGRRSMLDDTCRQKRVRRDLHRFRVAPVLQRVLGKQCGENLRVIQLAECRQSLHGRVARQPARLLDCHLEAIGCRLQAVRLLINQIAESLGRFCELPRCCLALEFRFDLRTHVDQRTLRASLDAVCGDDWVLEFLLPQPGHLILFLFNTSR